ncbi:hypothetical protein K501DRAFT_280951 [Backusella circina FSU 941]|nr:hypothetical protein K501DRAFT_280951 [Backusella circina FSU 941]
MNLTAKWITKQDSDADSDYHGNFNADKFEKLVEYLCDASQKLDARLSKSKNKSVFASWLETHTVKLEDIPCSSKSLSKAELLDTVGKVEMDTQFITHKIANKYIHKVIFTLPYHPEFQLIEKVWVIVKQPIAYNLDLNETCTKLQKKLVVSLKEVLAN